MDDDQQFCLRWNNHQSTLISVFDTLLENGTLVDCTLAAEGKFLKAHKVVLSACSPYFAALLSQQYDKHPIFILKDVKFQELRAMMDYMYRGEVNISQDQLAALLKAAESLQIKGLSDNRGSSSNAPSQLKQQQQQQQQSETSTTKTLQPPVPANKAPGLTIENKKPLKAELGDSDRSGSREGSTSPTLRKRKKIRRRSVDTNNLIDNHDQHSNSSSHSMHTLQPQALALTSSSIVASVPAANCATSLSSSTTSPSNSTNVLVMSAAAAAAAAAAAIKKTEPVQQQQVAEASKLQLVKHQSQQQSQQQQAQHTDDEERSGTDQGDAICDRDSDNDIDEPQSKRQAQGSVSIDSQDDKSLNQSELMIEPKNEYDDGQDENVEDLTLDEEELLDDLDQAGPSHGGEGSSQGYAQWQMEREQSEAFMAAQDAVGGQHREAQDETRNRLALSASHILGIVTAAEGNDCSRNKMVEEVMITDDEFIHLDTLYNDVSKQVVVAPGEFITNNDSLLIGDHLVIDCHDSAALSAEETLAEIQSPVKEIISYQRYGKIDKTVLTNLNFKCHLCGFSCAIRETLLKHFDEVHPL